MNGIHAEEIAWIALAESSAFMSTFGAIVIALDRGACSPAPPRGVNGDFAVF
jgi:hypothetical protein